MTQRQDKEHLAELLQEIVRQHDQPELIISQAYQDGGVDPLWPRFERAAINQIEDGKSTVSRYGIWANTVRDNIVEAMRVLESGDALAAHTHLVRAANCLSAFSEFQALFDPWKKD